MGGAATDFEYSIGDANGEVTRRHDGLAPEQIKGDDRSFTPGASEFSKSAAVLATASGGSLPSTFTAYVFGEES